MNVQSNDGHCQPIDSSFMLILKYNHIKVVNVIETEKPTINPGNLILRNSGDNELVNWY